MNKIGKYLWWTSLCLAMSLLATKAAEESETTLKDHGLAAGQVTEVLPQGAVLHLQLNQFYESLLNFEKLAKSIIPIKAVPPQMQPILQDRHPLMTFLGMQTIKEPLTAENAREKFGLDPERPLTVTLYPGDPRKLFIVGVPMAHPQALTGFLKSLLRPKVWEEVSLGNKSAVRVEPAKAGALRELYIVCSEDMAYICGDRSLVLSLYHTPSSQRLSADAFMSRTLEALEDQDFELIFNPSLLKPLLLQAQQFRFLAVPLIRAQREVLMSKIPKEARARIDQQLRRDLGVKDLTEFVDYVESVVLATYNYLLDTVVRELTAFEGFSVSAKLEAAYPQETIRVYSSRIQPETATAAIPMNQARQAISWLGQGYDSYTIEGKRPKAKPASGLLAWLQQVRQQVEQRGLKTGFLDRWEEYIKEQSPPQPLEAKVPWTLTFAAPLNSLPDIHQAESLEEYGKELGSSFQLRPNQPVKLIPGQDLDFLRAHFQARAETLNENYQAEADFSKSLSGRKSFIVKEHRFDSEEMQSDIVKFILEKAFLTRRGFFGYDQHEFVNRKFYLAREMDNYLVFHQGASDSSWLAELDQREELETPPAISKLLDRVPQGANLIQIRRTLHRLPEYVEWLSGLEDLIHRELRNYLEQARQAVKEAPSPEEAQEKLEALSMPALVYSLNRDSETETLYLTLPGNLVFPRQKVTPILKDLLSGFAAQARQVGGSLQYTHVQPEVWEWSFTQNTEAFARLISTVGNRLFENYLGDPEKQQELRNSVITERDTKRENFEEILVKNPRWAFLPEPKEKSEAQAPAEIPERDEQCPPELIDLSAHYNGALGEDWQVGGVPNNSLKNLPTGLQEFSGVKFDVRGIIQLSGKGAEENLQVKFPEAVNGIQVGMKGEQIHFLHAAAWSDPDGTKVGHFTVHYAGGQTEEIPIVYGEDVRDWWSQSNEPSEDKAQVAWSGPNSATADGNPPKRVFKTTWQNPHPDLLIESIDYVSAMANSAPFLIAITVGE